ncbi:unnamed protein product [Pylaiella littoralis]
MVWRVPSRRSPALDTLRTGWWMSSERGVPTVAASSVRAVVRQVPTRRSSAFGHAKDGMVDVVNKKRCNYPGCTKYPIYGAVGTKTAEFCSVHAKCGMVNVINKRCAHRGQTKCGGYQDGGVLLWTRHGRNGGRHQQEMHPP